MNDERINELCRMTTAPHVLNALHACRDGHPLGRDNHWKWRNAYALVMLHPVTFRRADIRWLRDEAFMEDVQEAQRQLAQQPNYGVLS